MHQDEQQRDIRYQSALNEGWNPDVGQYQSYGIEVCLPAEQQAKIMRNIRDISTNKPFVDKLVDKCNQHQLSVLHLRDIVEDSLP